eukprot:GILI01002527.1.p1 GENE.GILI01002527.1~~GILI01002527.1.p1  ORF type:complete len:606 (-),score=141.94 GILI01002527.1:215-2032(-)
MTYSSVSKQDTYIPFPEDISAPVGALSSSSASVEPSAAPKSFSEKYTWPYIKEQLKHNGKSGITVALVNLPLSISLAVAASSTPVSGVVTAFWSGLMMSFFGGSEYNVVGPTGALSGILAHCVLTYGLDSLPYLCILCGLMSFVVYIFKWERYISLVPASVTEGFTLGVAFIIALNQLNFAFGLGKLPRHDSLPENVIETLTHLGEANGAAALTFFLSFTVLLTLIKLMPKVPWVIVISALGILFGWMCTEGVLSINMPTLFTRYGELDLAIISFTPWHSNFLSFNFVGDCLPIVFVAVLETLISAKIADNMTKTKFDRRREVLGISICNVVCGAFGGIPATAALARTALNIKSGATSRLSGFVNTVTVMLLSLVFLRWFKYLPLPVVAAQVCVVAVRMVDPEAIIRLWQYDRPVFWETIVVALICILKDPTVGIVCGMMVSLLLFAESLSAGHREVVIRDEAGNAIGEKGVSVPDDFLPNQPADGQTVYYRIGGQLTHANAEKHAHAIESFAYATTIVISLRYVFHADLEGVLTLGEVVQKLQNQGKRVYLSTINPQVSTYLVNFPWYMEKVRAGEVITENESPIHRRNVVNGVNASPRMGLVN